MRKKHNLRSSCKLHNHLQLLRLSYHSLLLVLPPCTSYKKLLGKQLEEVNILAALNYKKQHVPYWDILCDTIHMVWHNRKENEQYPLNNWALPTAFYSGDIKGTSDSFLLTSGQGSICTIFLFPEKGWMLTCHLCRYLFFLNQLVLNLHLAPVVKRGDKLLSSG